jgi:hypothetical protein
MNHARLIFEDTPAFIPVPKELQHRKTEIIFLPLDDELTPQSAQQTAVEQNETAKKPDLLEPDAFFASLQKIDTEHPRSLLELIGKGKGCFKNADEVDAFICAERDAWDD